MVSVFDVAKLSSFTKFDTYLSKKNVIENILRICKVSSIAEQCPEFAFPGFTDLCF